MATNQGDKALAADRNAFFNKFLLTVKNPIMGVGSSNPSVVWYTGVHPQWNRAPLPSRLSNKTFNPTDPSGSSGIANSVEFTSAAPQIDSILNAIYAYANQMTRFRMTTWNLTTTPGPDSTGGPARTALNNTFLTSLTLDKSAFAVGRTIKMTDVDNFMTALKAGLDALPQPNITVCHSSCHSSCHGARGRR